MTDNKAIVPVQQHQLLSTFDDVQRAATAMSASGFFSDSKQASQAIVKILAGQELGFGPFASMTGVYIIQGRPSISANLMAAAVKKSGRYNYRVIEMTNEACEIAFYEAGQEMGRSRFTKDDAAKAGTQNMNKYPRNMLFARAMSNGVKWYCPDVFNGSTVYTPEELGANVDEEGNVINAQVRDVTPLAQPPAPVAGMKETGEALGAKVTEQPAPANGNGKKAPTRDQLLSRLFDLEAEAENRGITTDSFNAEEATDEQIIERGKALRALLTTN